MHQKRPFNHGLLAVVLFVVPPPGLDYRATAADVPLLRGPGHV